MNRQQFYAKQLIDVTALMTLQAAPQAGIEDALVSIGAKGIVSGLGLTASLPQAWTFSIGIGKAILENGSIVNNVASLLETINTAVLTAPAVGTTFYAVFMIPKLTTNTPVLTPDGTTVNYIEFDDFSIVYVANAQQADTHPTPGVTAGGGYIGVRLGDIARYTAQANIGAADIDLTYADEANTLASNNYFDKSKGTQAYTGTFTCGAMTIPQSGSLSVGGPTALNSLTANQVVTAFLYTNLLQAQDRTASISLGATVQNPAGEIDLQGTANFNYNVNIAAMLKIGRFTTQGFQNPALVPSVSTVIPGGTCALAPGSNDCSGSVTIGIGSSVGGDVGLTRLCTITFATPYPKAPRVFITRGDGNGGNLQEWVQSGLDGGNSFIICSGVGAVIPLNCLLGFNYFVVQV